MTIRPPKSGTGLDHPNQARQSCVRSGRRDRHRPTTISGRARARPNKLKIPAAESGVSATAQSRATRYTVPVVTSVANPVPNAAPNSSEWRTVPKRLQSRGTIHPPEGGRKRVNRTGLRSSAAATTKADARTALVGRSPPSDCSTTPTTAPAAMAPRAKMPGPPRNRRNQGFASPPTGDVIT